MVRRSSYLHIIDEKVRLQTMLFDLSNFGEHDNMIIDQYGLIVKKKDGQKNGQNGQKSKATTPNTTGAGQKNKTWTQNQNLHPMFEGLEVDDTGRVVSGNIEHFMSEIGAVQDDDDDDDDKDDRKRAKERPKDQGELITSFRQMFGGEVSKASDPDNPFSGFQTDQNGTRNDQDISAVGGSDSDSGRGTREEEGNGADGRSSRDFSSVQAEKDKGVATDSDSGKTQDNSVDEVQSWKKKKKEKLPPLPPHEMFNDDEIYTLYGQTEANMTSSSSSEGDAKKGSSKWKKKKNFENDPPLYDRTNVYIDMDGKIRSKASQLYSVQNGSDGNPFDSELDEEELEELRQQQKYSNYIEYLIENSALSDGQPLQFDKIFIKIDKNETMAKNRASWKRRRRKQKERKKMIRARREEQRLKTAGETFDDAGGMHVRDRDDGDDEFVDNNGVHLLGENATTRGGVAYAGGEDGVLTRTDAEEREQDSTRKRLRKKRGMLTDSDTDTNATEKILSIKPRGYGFAKNLKPPKPQRRKFTEKMFMEMQNKWRAQHLGNKSFDWFDQGENGSLAWDNFNMSDDEFDAHMGNFDSDRDFPVDGKFSEDGDAYGDDGDDDDDVGVDREDDEYGFQAGDDDDDDESESDRRSRDKDRKMHADGVDQDDDDEVGDEDDFEDELSYDDDDEEYDDDDDDSDIDGDDFEAYDGVSGAEDSDMDTAADDDDDDDDDDSPDKAGNDAAVEGQDADGVVPKKGKKKKKKKKVRENIPYYFPAKEKDWDDTLSTDDD